MKAKLLSLVGFSLQQHSLKTEVLSGLTTFTTMSYILALMPIMFAPIAAQGYPVESLLTATTLATIVGTLLMAFLAKRPFGQAPGLAINLFFVETVCLSLGYTWQFALTAVFLEGVLFVLLCISNLRQIIFEMIPASLKYAIAAGIGFFIAMIGFKNSGLLAEGTIFNHIHTLVSAPSLLFLLGLVLAGIFIVLRVRGGLLLTIIIITLIGWEDLLTPDLWVCVLTMLFFDVFDTLGSVVGLMANTGHIRPNGRIPHMRNIMLSDAIATITGACLGCSTVTTYVESATGVAEGGRTGLTALVIASCFGISLFLAPLFLAIPAAATAPIMVMAGYYLFGSIRHIRLARPAETMPAFLTILIMPVTGSITDGIVAGLFTYVVFSFIDGWMNRYKQNKNRIPE